MTQLPEVSRQRLRRLAVFLARLRPHLRFVGARDAEAAAERLAVRLRRTLARHGLAAPVWRPIPRGGLIVLGLLAYHLEFGRERPWDDAGEGPLVVVDDCALSGLRLRRELERVPGERRIVVAHLYSAPELRRSVLEAEPRVVACVAAGDLADRSRQIYPHPEEHRAWRRRWRERLDADRRYWLGLPELVAFPWNEPDRPFWNAVTERMEDGWRFVPPHRCTKNRARLAAGLPDGVRREVAEAAPGGWRLADGVAWGVFEEVVWLVRTDTGRVYSLDGPAALAWRVLVAGGGAGTAARALAGEYAVEAATAHRDVDALTADLTAAGLLEHAP